MRPFSTSKLALAYAIDLAVGDPPGMPHPVRLIGGFISAGERLCRPGRSPSGDFLTGAAISVLAVACSWIAASQSIALLRRLNPTFGSILEVMLTWTALATGSLISEASAVITALESGQLQHARNLLSRIVGRDTAGLDPSEIARAVIETLAESLCDAIIAPLFYLELGGVPLALAYKAVNTLDSMIGHPEPPHTYFGRFAARFDDAANFIPARISALSIVAAAALCGAHHRDAFRTWLKDGHKHPSPNAGQSEAAMAGALHVQLGGTNYYQGKPSYKPLLGAKLGAPSAPIARQAIELTRIASFLAFTAALALIFVYDKRDRR